MNPEFDNQLEAEIDRQLKDLPDLTAPSSLIRRTMTAIERPAAPWYARPWSAWPAELRTAYLFVTIGAAAGAFTALRELGPRLFGPLGGRLAAWRAGAECLWNAIGALAGAASVIVNHWGKGVVLPCILVMVLSYAACVGFGTVFVRLAVSGSRKN